MKKVVLSGYYGFNNIGDEAVLAAIIQALQREIPQVEISVLSHDPPNTEKLYGVQGVNRWRLKEIVSAIKRTDIFISGGGSLLQDVTGSKSIIYYLALILLAEIFRKPVLIYAQGIGPVKRSWARRFMALVLNRVTMITVRDELSGKDLAAMGVEKPPILVTVDPVLGLSGFPKSPSRKDEINKQEMTVGISLRSWPGLDLGEVAILADYLVNQGFKVIFLPFHFPEDVTTCQKARDLMTGKSDLIQENLTVHEMIKALSRIDLVIGMRLHALIMAAAQGIPFVAISYDPKVERFTKQMGQRLACSVADLKGRNLIEAVEQTIENYSLIKKELLAQGQAYQSLAYRPAVEAAKILNKDTEIHEK